MDLPEMHGWHGKGKTLQQPRLFIASKEFYFGGRIIPQGWIVRQFETRNFGFTHARNPNDSSQSILAKE